jgi:hypothetical protein
MAGAFSGKVAAGFPKKMRPNLCWSIFRKSGCRFSEENATKSMLEHFPEKWLPVFRRKCDQL